MYLSLELTWVSLVFSLMRLHSDLMELLVYMIELVNIVELFRKGPSLGDSFKMLN